MVYNRWIDRPAVGRPAPCVQVELYRRLRPEVRDFVAKHIHLYLLHESAELPRDPHDHRRLFSVLAGSVIGVTGELSGTSLLRLLTMDLQTPDNELSQREVGGLRT